MSAAVEPLHITLGHAAGLFAPTEGGRHVHVQTLRKWARDGVRLPDGRRVRLGTVKVGRRRCTTLDAVAAFVEELNTGDGRATASGGDGGRSEPRGASPIEDEQ